MASVKAEIVLDLLRRFPKTPHLTLAKKAYKENPVVFSNVDDARSVIRYHTGKIGKCNLKKLEDKSFVKKDDGERNPFKALPKGISYFDEWSFFQIPGHKILIIADLHVPYYSREALEIALEDGIRSGVGTIVINGDLTDFYKGSKFAIDPRKREMYEEVQMTRQVLGVLREAFPNASIIYKLGNHEERWESYLWAKAPELLGFEFVSYEFLFGAKELDLQIVSDRRVMQFGKLNVIHGHEFGSGVTSPVNPARTLQLKAKTNALAAHNHQPSHQPAGTIDGEMFGCWSIGALCDLNPRYRPLNDWQHGFAVVERIDEKGGFLVFNKRIIQGKIYPA